MGAKILRLEQAPQPTVQPENMLEDYVDHLLAPLVGIIEFEERKRLREETLSALELRYRDYVMRGEVPEDAAKRAIERYGRSDKIGLDYLENWMRRRSGGFLARKIGFPNVYAALFFGQAALWSYILLELRIMNPSMISVKYPIDIAYGDLRKIIPEPIPLPDDNPFTYLFVAFVVIAPIAAGFLTGRIALVHAVRAVYQVSVLVALGGFLLGVAMLPAYEGLFLAVAQLFWWLPVGCLSAYVAAALTWRRRCVYPSNPVRRKS